MPKVAYNREGSRPTGEAPPDLRGCDSSDSPCLSFPTNGSATAAVSPPGLSAHGRTLSTATIRPLLVVSTGVMHPGYRVVISRLTRTGSGLSPTVPKASPCCCCRWRPCPCCCWGCGAFFSLPAACAAILRGLFFRFEFLLLGLLALFLHE